MTDTRPAAFRALELAMLRAPAGPHLLAVPIPDLTGDDQSALAEQVGWLAQVWADESVTEALSHASPGLATQLRTLRESSTPRDPRKVRRAVLATLRYLRRAGGRTTPFGYLAGVAPVAFASTPAHQRGTEDLVVVRAGAAWLARVIADLEDCPQLLERLPVVANTMLARRGDRVVVPHQPIEQPGGQVGAAEKTLRYTPVVALVLDAARMPVAVADLAAKLRAEFPATSGHTIATTLRELVRAGVLISGLRAPSTETDALAHLLRQLQSAGAEDTPVADLCATLVAIRGLLVQGTQPVSDVAAREHRVRAAKLMGEVTSASQHPLAVDLRLDETTVLPEAVRVEVERAALLLTRLSPAPAGARAWRDYHQAFYERFGLGALIPVADVVADSGIGWPAGYPGTTRPEPPSARTARDEILLDLAHRAVLDGLEEIVLDDALVARLDQRPEDFRPPMHLELAVRVHADDLAALQDGDFQVEITRASRAAGVLIGRFLPLLGADAVAALSALPGVDEGTVAVQLSFPPLDAGTAHVTRTPQFLPSVLRVAEYYHPTDQDTECGEDTLLLDEVMVGCDGRRMYLAVPRLGQRIEPVGAHSLNLMKHTPPMARLLTELGRAQCAQITTFHWGAAETLPYLPRVRYRRVILAPARWRLDGADLPAGGSVTAWEAAFAGWRDRRRAPRWVQLVEEDRALPLDLDEHVDRVLLREQLAGAGSVTLIEAPPPQRLGWCGGRNHEVVVPLVATRPPAWPPLPRPVRERVVTHSTAMRPGTSPMVLAALYGDAARQDTLLAEHLPELLERLDDPPWWFVRFRDPRHHLRLRIALTDPGEFGPAAAVISGWAAEREATGLLAHVTYPTSYPEYGRWGSGQAWEAAEEVFRADSRAVSTQLALPQRPARAALAAAHVVAIAAAFTGSVEDGMRWLITHLPAHAPARVPRPVFTEAVRLANPDDEWAALRAAPGGPQIVTTWPDRHAAVFTYRTRLTGPDAAGIRLDAVLDSLLHLNYVRGHALDFRAEATAFYLARCAAQTWTAHRPAVTR